MENVEKSLKIKINNNDFKGIKNHFRLRMDECGIKLSDN